MADEKDLDRNVYSLLRDKNDIRIHASLSLLQYFYISALNSFARNYYYFQSERKTETTFTFTITIVAHLLNRKRN